MDWRRILWDLDDDPAGNVAHVAENDLTPEDVEAVLSAPVREGTSRTTGLPVAWGYVPDGRYVLVVYQVIDADTIRPVTAYEVNEPKVKRWRKN
jgi:uncharacterized DUF497 family protein